MNLLKQFFLEDVGLKLISLLLAFLLWFQIAGQQTVQRNVVLPVEFTNMPNDLEISNDYQRQVEVLITKRAGVAMDERQLAAIVNVGDLGPGTQIVPLTPENIRNVPFGVEVEKVEPARIRLRLERTRRKMVSVTPEIIGEPAQGHELRELRLSPSQVLVSGPESRLNAVSSAHTEPIDLNGRAQSFTERVYLDLEDPRLRIENRDAVDAFVTIEEERREAILSSVPVRVEPARRGTTLNPARVEVIGTVPQSFSEEIVQNKFRVVVRLEDSASGSITATPVVVIPPEYENVFRVTAINPPVVEVNIR